MDNLRVGVAGATGALGREIVGLLDQAKWRPSALVPLASASTNVSFVDYGGERIAVDDLAGEALDSLDALILAVPSDVAIEAAERAAEEGTLVVDCSGAFLADPEVPLCVPWVNPQALSEPLRGIVSIPSSAATLLASSLGPLTRAGVEGPFNATVLMPASTWGRAGIEELSRQVVSLFNAGTPPRKVFEHGLAFDLLPQLGTLDESGWTHDELSVTEELRQILGIQTELDVSLVAAPLFSGVSANCELRPSRHVPVELARQILSDGGVRLGEDESARACPRPRRVEGQPFAHVGRIRLDGTGNLHFWLAMDNLRASAAVAVSACGVLVRQ
jgi:aspartate-semialdehyde dehydrogenase